jgi:hypothetical protein
MKQTSIFLKQAATPFVWFVRFVVPILLVTSCDITVTPTAPDNALLREQYAAGTTGGHLTVYDFFTDVSGDLTGASLNVSSEPKVTAFLLNLNPDLGLTKETLESAFVFRKLDNEKETGEDVDDTTAPAAYAANGNITYTVKMINDGLARITLTNLATVNSSYIELRVKASALKGAGGIGIDTNGNSIEGEDGDDVYVNVPVTGSSNTAATGAAVRKPFAGLDFTPEPNPTLTATTTSIAGSATWNTALNGETNTYLNTLAGKHLKLQKLNFNTGAWTDVAVTWTTTTATPRVSSFTLTDTFAEWDVYRLIAVNPNDLVTEKKYYGFIQKPAYRAAKTVKLAGPKVISKTNVATGYSAAATAYFDAAGKNGVIRVAFTDLPSEGLKASTVTKDNFRLYAGTFSGAGYVAYPVRGIPIKEARLATAAEIGESAAEAKNVVVIFLDPAYTKGNFSTKLGASYLQVWAGPGLQTNEDPAKSFGSGDNYATGTEKHFQYLTATNSNL